MASSEERIRHYPSYLSRYGELVGDMQFGQYGHYRSRLVCKLDEAQYQAKVETYLELGGRFVRTVAAGDTIDDALAVALRGTEVELVLEDSLFLPSRKKNPE